MYDFAIKMYKRTNFYTFKQDMKRRSSTKDTALFVQQKEQAFFACSDVVRFVDRYAKNLTIYLSSYKIQFTVINLT